MVRRTLKIEERVPLTSSVPAVLAAKQESLYREVLKLLEKARVRYAVAGAEALREYTGICRNTKDLDIFLGTREASRALRTMAEHGFETEVRDPVWLAKTHRDGFFVDFITGMSNGVWAVDDSWINRSHPASLFGVKTRVLAPEELLISKLFVVRRERFDGADIAHIIYSSQGNLQWKRILDLAGEHWEMLLWALILFRYVYPAQTGYVPQWLWRDLLIRFGREVDSPDAGARFRGSLVDENMFAIDLKEWRLDNLLETNRAQSCRMAAPARKRSA
jgi:nucleotidyltransferase DUF2204